MIEVIVIVRNRVLPVRKLIIFDEYLLRFTAVEFGVGYQSVDYHAENHLPGKLVRPVREQKQAHAANILDRMSDLLNRTKTILDKAEGAKLLVALVAKLDRLTRNIAFLFTLKKELEATGVGFTIADMQETNNMMMLGVMAMIAQHEAEIISQRTKAGIRQSDVYKAGQWGNLKGLPSYSAPTKGVGNVCRHSRGSKNRGVPDEEQQKVLPRDCPPDIPAIYRRHRLRRA